MDYGKLYFFVEGNDDEIFFIRIIAPLFYSKFKSVEIIKYSQMKKDKVNLFLISIDTLNFNYLLFADKDESLSINQKKMLIYDRFDNVNTNNIIIVVVEIESWLIAGLDESASEELHINYTDDTGQLTKEDFNRMYHGRFHSRIDFIYEILKLYSIETARRKNKSFSFFYENFLKTPI